MPEEDSSNIFDFLSEEANRLLGETDADVWATQPVSFLEFITDHLNLPKLSDRQYQDLITFLGEEPKKVFSQSLDDMGSPFNLFCLLAGKGSGKDYMASMVVCYVLYLTLCMKNPQEYFGWPAGEAIDIVIVSYSTDQALLISFDKIKQRLKNWWWLRQHYSVIWGEKYITAKGRPEIWVHNDMIRTHNNVRIISEHSANESYEGYNILFFIMSEASAFKSLTKERNGQKVFNTLKSSASSRFPGRWKGMVMSFPRFDEDADFTYLLHKEGVERGQIGLEEGASSRIFTSRGFTWDFKPARFYSGQTVEFEGYQIPIEYQEEAEADPEAFKRMYMCIPGKTGSLIMPEEVILRSLHDKPPLLVFEQSIERGKIQAVVHGLAHREFFVDRYLITVDLGEVHSAAAIGIQHFDMHQGYILDAIGAWTPDLERGYPVDLENVREVLIEVAKTLPQPIVAFDQWQSRLMRADLNRAGIKTAEYHTYERDYKSFRQGMALGVAKILKYQPLVTQLKALKEVNGAIMLDTKISKRKDLVDVVVGGFKMIMEGIRTTSLPGTIITENVGDFGSIIYGNEGFHMAGRR